VSPSTVWSTLLMYGQGWTGWHGYTSPLGIVTVVCDLDAYWSGSDGGWMAMRGILEQSIDYWAYGTGGAGANTHQWRGRQVIPPGYNLTVMIEGDPIDVTISGYQLKAPP